MALFMYSKESIWELIKKLVIPSDNLILLVKKKEDIYIRLDSTLKPGDSIKLELNLEEPGYLVLIQKGCSGFFWCLTPSSLVTTGYLNAGKHIIPSSPEWEELTITEHLGKDETIAIIFQNKPDLDWLPKANQDDPEPMTTDQMHLLYGEINKQNDNVSVFYTENTVITVQDKSHKLRSQNNDVF